MSFPRSFLWSAFRPCRPFKEGSSHTRPSFHVVWCGTRLHQPGRGNMLTFWFFHTLKRLLNAHICKRHQTIKNRGFRNCQEDSVSARSVTNCNMRSSIRFWQHTDIFRMRLCLGWKRLCFRGDKAVFGVKKAVFRSFVILWYQDTWHSSGKVSFFLRTALSLCNWLAFAKEMITPGGINWN